MLFSCAMINQDVLISVIEHVAGHDVLPLIDVLKGKKNVSEFTIAEELREEINTIRNKLYRLYDSNLVEFTRKKDKKKGWYIYYWTFVPSRIPFLLKDLKKKKLEKLHERLRVEQQSNFFACSNKCMRLTFDKAVDFEFKCPECGSLMNQEDNGKKIEQLVKDIQVIEAEIKHDSGFVQEQPLEELEELPLAKKKVVKAVITKAKVVSKPKKKSK
jgi:transcription initiation factor TFIIE subunit alpha